LIRIDDIDKGIINYLRDNARCTNDVLAKHVGANIQTVMYRVNRLVKAKIIRKFTLILDNWKLGYKIVAYIRLDIHPSRLLEVIRNILSLKKVTWLSEGSTKTELHFQVKFIDQNSLRKFIHEKLTPLEGIQNIQVGLILNSIGKHYV